MAQVTIIGNITSDLEVKYTQNGKARISFGIAENRRWKGQDGNFVEATSFFNVVAWGDLAENITKSLGKGSRVVVVGRLDQRSWSTESGEKRSTVEVVADEISPSLKWATCSVTKIAKDGGSPSSTYGTGSTPASDKFVVDDNEPF